MPTCTEIGWEAYKTCSRCDYTTYAEIAATGHTPGAAATCTEPQICTVCGTELQAALGHTPGAAATCTTSQVCTVCGIELEAALGHKAGPAATCTTAQLCTVCGAELAAALGHVPVVDAAKAPTCTETGLEAGAHCSRCEEVLLEQAEIPALGHNLLYAEDNRTDCTEDGIQTRRCSRCDYVEEKEVSGGSHSYRPGKILRESTCKEVGTQQIVCVYCGATDEVEIARKQHKAITVEEIPATCTEAGMTYGIMCSVCGTELLGRSVIPAQGHCIIFVPEISPTETENGVKAHYSCADCGMLFADEDGSVPVSAEDLAIPALDEDEPDVPEDPADPEDPEDGLKPWQWACIIAACVVVKIALVAIIIASVKNSKKNKRPKTAKTKANTKKR